MQAKAEALSRWAEQSLILCEAIWTLTRDKLGLTDEDLIARVNEIDAADGKLDGRVRHEPQPCPKCNRTSPARFDKCMYCGREREKTAFAR